VRIPGEVSDISLAAGEPPSETRELKWHALQCSVSQMWTTRSWTTWKAPLAKLIDEWHWVRITQGIRP